MDWILFFHMFLTKKDIFFGFLEVIPQNIFNNPVQTNMFILIKQFAEKYQRMPELDVLQLLLDILPETERENKNAYLAFIAQVQKVTADLDIDVFQDRLTKAIQDYEIEQFILRSANKVGQITLDEMLGDMRSLMTKFTPKSIGIDVTDVERSLKFMRQNHQDKTSTGIDELDKVLFGGYGSDEITILMAASGKGKSFFLLNAMYYAMLAGKSVLYVTLELSERSVIRRFYSRVAYASKRDLLDEAVVAQRAKKFFTLADACGRVVYQPGLTLTVAGLEAMIEQQLLYFEFKPDVLIVDYLDRLAPRKTDYKSELRHQLRNITDDLRSISLKHSIPIITATQANRAALSKLKITEANVSESYGKVEVADVILALCQTDDEKASKRARLVVLKNRDYISGSTIEFYVDFDHMLLCDLDQARRLGLIADSFLDREIK